MWQFTSASDSSILLSMYLFTPTLVIFGIFFLFDFVIMFRFICFWLIIRKLNSFTKNLTSMFFFIIMIHKPASIGFYMLTASVIKELKYNWFFYRFFTDISRWNKWQTQSLRGVLKKRCSENMKQIYRRAPMPKCNFNKVALQKVKYISK